MNKIYMGRRLNQLCSLQVKGLTNIMKKMQGTKYVEFEVNEIQTDFGDNK